MEMGGGGLGMDFCEADNAHCEKRYNTTDFKCTLMDETLNPGGSLDKYVFALTFSRSSDCRWYT